MHIQPETKRLLVRLGIEIGLYAVLVAAYMFLVLTLFGGELVKLFKSNLVFYAGLALGLMVFQGLLLENITTFLIDRLEL